MTALLTGEGNRRWRWAAAICMSRRSYLDEPTSGVDPIAAAAVLDLNTDWPSRADGCSFDALH